MSTTNQPKEIITDLTEGHEPDVNLLCEELLRFENETLEGILDAAQNAATTENDPKKKAWNQAIFEALKKRLEWKESKKEPGLFRLFQHPSGATKAILDESLFIRKADLNIGVNPEKKNLSAILEAFGSFVFGGSIGPKQEIPKMTDIPIPEILGSGRSNVIEVHRAAVSIVNKTIVASQVFAILQRTLRPRIVDLRKGSKEERMAKSKKLKSDLGKAIDAFATGHEEPVSHGNKPLFKDNLDSLQSAAPLAIEEGRRLFEESGQLPTKFKLRERLLEKYPHLKISDRQWPEVLKEAGLDSLPSKSPHFQ